VNDGVLSENSNATMSPTGNLNERNQQDNNQGGGLRQVKRPANEEMKSSYMHEIDQLQRLLVKNRINIQTKVLQKAFIMPEGFGVNQMVTEGRSYPSPAYGLMPNLA